MKKGKTAMQLETSRDGKISEQIRFICRVAILAVALLLLTREITGWFTGWHDWNNAIYSIFARNHIQYGLGYTKLFLTWGDTILPPADPQRYLNHPPLIALWAAIPMLIFGDHEWVARLVPIVATLGSAWVLMVIVSRLHSKVLGLLSGFFYVILPITAYFGRMLDQTSPSQFFSLLMLHGYLQWSGLYGKEYRKKNGAVYYILGAVLGIGTGWASVVMAGLIWFWEFFRVLRHRLGYQLLLWLTMIPAISLAVVVVHILWGCQWDASLFGPMFLSRTLNPQYPVPWAEWFNVNWRYLVTNVSYFGICAGIIYLVIIPVILRRSGSSSPFRQIVRDGTSVVPILLTALQGFIWVFVFKRQSGLHDYWQYFTGPFFAVAMAAVFLAIFTILSKVLPRASRLVILLLIILPMPFFAKSLDMLYQLRTFKEHNYIVVFKRMKHLVPPRAPVMVSEEYEWYSETLGSYTNYYLAPERAYYANRPLIYSTDFDEIEANRQGCAAYVLCLTGEPKLQQLAQRLKSRYKMVWSYGNYLIFSLDD